VPGLGAARRVGGVRRCLTRRPGRPADRRRRVRRCRDHRWRGGRQRTPGAEAPGSVRKPPEGGCAAPRCPGRSAGCRGRLDQPASAGLGTEPGRSRPGDRGEGRSAGRRCVSGETCRPRCITAPPARSGDSPPRPYKVGRSSTGAAPACHAGAVSPFCRGQAVPDPPARQGRSIEGRWSRRCQCRERWPVGHDRLPRLRRGRATHRLAPTRWDDPSQIGDGGITVMRDPPSGRGQAVPDPPARQGRPSPRAVRMTTVRGALPPPGRITARCRAGAQRARQRVAPTRKGAAPAGACGRSPGQPTTPAWERQALPDP